VKYMSSRYKQWQANFQFELDHQSDWDGETFVRCRLDVLFYQATLRRLDMDNQLKSLGDVLQETGIIEDDCWRLMRPVLLDATHDPVSPGAEITITEILD